MKSHWSYLRLNSRPPPLPPNSVHSSLPSVKQCDFIFLWALPQHLLLHRILLLTQPSNPGVSGRGQERAFYLKLVTESCPLPFVFGRMETSQGDQEPWRGQHGGLQDWHAPEWLPRNKIPYVTGFVAFSHQHCREKSIFWLFLIVPKLQVGWEEMAGD